MNKAFLFIVLLAGLLALSGCVSFDSPESGNYSCSYESRHTGCGGKDWSEWKAECYAFNMDDYRAEWAPEKVCGEYTGSNTNCGGGCCIDIEYRNNSLSGNGC